MPNIVSKCTLSVPARVGGSGWVALGPLPTFILREFMDELLPFIHIMCDISMQHGALPESKKIGHRHTDPQKVWPRSRRRPELPPDIKPDLPIQGHRKDCCLTADRIPPGEQIVSRSSVSQPTNRDTPQRPPSWRSSPTFWMPPIRLRWLSLDCATFDTVDHDILLTRLQVSYGVSGSALSWIASFILHRSQSVNFNGQISARLQMRYGVPQGSVLGPLLFIRHTADVISNATSHGVGAHSYADDSQLYLHCPSTNQSIAASRLAKCIKSVERWMRSNRLKLNSDKTQFMWLGSKQQLAKIETECMQIGEHCIKFSTSAKNLGVTFDPELMMGLLVNNITRSCFFQLRQLRSIRRSLTMESLTMEATKTLVHSLVSSRVNYCNNIFYGATNAVLRRLQSVLNAAARLITNTRKFDHITPVLRDQLHWLPIR